MENNRERETKGWYAAYYSTQGAWRNDLVQNPEVAFQVFANDLALIRAIRGIGVNASAARLLDVGCGSGAGLVTFLRLGFFAENMTGIDIQPERFDEARRRLPNAHLVHGDAANMPFATGAFDVIFQSTMFVQLTDEALAGRIASEMLRVCKPGGKIILSDWRYSKPFNRSYLGLSSARIRRLFAVGQQSQEHSRYRAALVPPVGRPLSRFAPSAYFLVHAMFPFLSGHVVTVLNRT